MSSISAQGVVERASAELTKRINGLRGGKHHNNPANSNSAHNSTTSQSSSPAGTNANSTNSTTSTTTGATSNKTTTSVMERVTNVFCGGGNNTLSSSSSPGNNHNQQSPAGGGGQQVAGVPAPPEKPSRMLLPLVGGGGTGKQQVGKLIGAVSNAAASATGNSRSRLVGHHGGAGRGHKPPLPPQSQQHHQVVQMHQVHLVPYLGWEQLMVDDRFMGKFFMYFNARDRCVLAQVCVRWRDILYRAPRYWAGLLPVLQCKELRHSAGTERVKLYTSLLRRGFHGLCLLGAGDEDAADLVNSFPLAGKHVHSLSLRGSSVSDRGLESLLDHLQALYELELAGCNEITEAGLWACLNPRIVSLTLTDCINVADEAVGAVAQLLPALYEFSLQAYHVTDAALGYFSPKQSNSLNILRLHSCWELTNHGVVNIVHSLPNLTVLSLSGCSKITDDGVELIAENLQKLRSLDLSWCPRITDAALEYIACDLNQLEELTLDRCVHVTDIGVGYISTMLTLSALYLRWCSQLRDFGLQHLCGMRNLQILSLAGCPLLTSSGLSSLIQLRHMRELELTNCPGASRELFDYLREHLPRCLVIE